MKLLFLGTGTSTGVPQIGCDCAACRSLDPCDKRLRCSAVAKTPTANLLIDCGPDFYTQIMRTNAMPLDALLVTHSHYDHVGGIDDLRPYCAKGPFPVYCTSDVATDLRNRVPYCFKENPYPGVPSFDMRIIKPMESFTVNGIDVLPLPIMHYKLPILGYKFNNLAYITDCKTLPDETLQAIKGIDTLVLNALRIEPHMSHLHLAAALDIADKVGARQTYFTHISHDMGPAATVKLPSTYSLAHDLLEIDIKQPN